MLFPRKETKEKTRKEIKRSILIKKVGNIGGQRFLRRSNFTF